MNDIIQTSNKFLRVQRSCKKIKTYSVFYCLFTLLLSFASLYTSEPVQYRLVSTDQLNMNRVNDEYVTNMRGNVHFFYADIEFKADMADIYEKQEYVVLKGNVLVIQDSLSISCESAQYYHQNLYLRVQTNVVITELHHEGTFRKVTSNQGTQYRDRGEIILQGNVFAHDTRESLFASSEYAAFSQQTGYGYMIQSPKVWRTGADSLALAAEKIEFYEENSKMVASFDVITQNKEIEVRSDFLIYYGDEAKMVYIGDPRFYSHNGDGKADLITVFLENNDINEIHMEGNCFIEFSSNNSTEKHNWLSSDYMTLFYNENKPQEFIATENVKSFFVQEQNQNRDVQDNHVLGEEMNILFDDDSNISQLRINAKVKGKYRFKGRGF